VECAAQAGTEYVLCGNGFGPKNSPLQDGVPATYNGALTPLEVPGCPASCQLISGGQTARVDCRGRRSRPDHQAIEFRVGVRRLDWFALRGRDPRNQRRHGQIQGPCTPMTREATFR
jgi:hypothetical protein